MKEKGFEIVGIEGIQNILEEVAPKHARNLMRATVHGVASTIAKDARANAPKRTGNLKKAIKAKRKKSPPDKPISEVYVTHGNNAKHDAFYWRFVEYPTGGENPQPEQPFIRPAFDKAVANYETVFTQQFGKKLEQAMTREAKKNAKK